MVEYRKRCFKKSLNYKKRTNSETKMKKDINKNRNILKKSESESIKRKKIKAKPKYNNEISNTNSKANFENLIIIKKLKVKEIKEKYHKLLRENKFINGSYDI